MTAIRNDKHLFVGQWRIVETELWDVDDLDMEEPATLTLKRGGLGTLNFLAIQADIDYRVVQRDGQPAIEFSLEGIDEGDQISGRGWAVLQDDELRGRLFIHRGDDSGFTASRSRTRGKSAGR